MGRQAGGRRPRRRQPGDRFTVLAAAVVYCGVGIPVTRRVLPGGEPGESWNDIRMALVERVTAALGDDWRAFVPTDRGPESAALFRAVPGAACRPPADCGW